MTTFGMRNFFRDHLPAMALDRANRFVNVPHADGTLESDHPAVRHELPPLLQQTADGANLLLACLDQVEIRRAPRLKRPSEDPLVKLFRPRHIVGINRESSNVVWHKRQYTGGLRVLACATLTINVVRPPSLDTGYKAHSGAGAVPRGAIPGHELRQRLPNRAPSAFLAPAPFRQLRSYDRFSAASFLDDSHRPSRVHPGSQPARDPNVGLRGDADALFFGVAHELREPKHATSSRSRRCCAS